MPVIFCLIIFLLPSRAGAQSFNSSNLPIIVINTNGQVIPDEPKIIADMGIIDNGPGQRNNVSDPFNNYSGKIGIELRGSSSQGFPKKQYGIELRNADGITDRDAALLGMPPEEDWVLFGPYNDKSLMRDVLAYKLGRDQGRYAPRTRFCELVLNGQYTGVYVLIEKIKRDIGRVNINRLNPTEISGNDLTGGYIIKIDKMSGNGGDGWTSQYAPRNRSGSQTIFFQYDVPDATDIVFQQKNYIKQFVDAFESVLISENFKDPVNGYQRYIDLDSFVDYFIVNEVSKNPDGYRLSTFLYKHRESEGNKLYMGPIWDYNLAFGNVDYCTNGTTTGFVTSFNTICPQDWWLIPFWWDRLMQDPAFCQRLSDRWLELRSGPYKTSTILTYIDSVATVLNAEAQQRNFQRWPVLGTYIWPNYFVGNSFQQEVEWLKNWITQRLLWLDGEIPSLVTSHTDPIANSISIVPNPFEEKVTISYTMQKVGVAHFSVNTIDGREVFTSGAEHYQTGRFTRELLLPQLKAGIYIVRYTLHGSTGALRLCKVR